jgi:hypothetical protein
MSSCEVFESELVCSLRAVFGKLVLSGSKALRPQNCKLIGWCFWKLDRWVRFFYEVTDVCWQRGWFLCLCNNTKFSILDILNAHVTEITPLHTLLFNFCLLLLRLGARGSVVGWGTVLQAGRSPVRVQDEVNFSIYLIFPATQWPWGRLSL